MKSIKVYFENELVISFKCDEIFQDNIDKVWLVYDNKILVGSIPMNYLIIKE